MSRRYLIVPLLALLAAAAGGVLGAQGVPQQPALGDAVSAQPDKPTASYDTPPAITLVDGSARLVRQGQAQQAVANMPLLEGDRILTDTGRVGVTFPDGTLLHLDRGTSVDFLSASLIRLNEGRVILAVAGRGGERPAADYRVDTQGGSVQVQSVGEYRVSTFAGEAVPAVDLAVMSGVATLMNDRGNVEVSAGQRSWARAGAVPEYARTFNSANMDEFDRWSDTQRNAYAANNANPVTVSGQYLPEDLASYSSTFDQYGTWQNTTDYGYVWYPRVAATWRPYYNGYWDYVGPYGWTWIGYDPWGWPTHHFGRWGFNAGLWFWIPMPYWGPAWVSWGYSSGYLSWCPLNYWNRPVFHIHDGYWGHGHHYEPWHGWTVAPRHSFGAGVRVASYAVSGNRIPVGERTGFAVQRAAPAPPRGGARAASGGSVFSSARAMPRALGPTPYSSGSRNYAASATPRSTGPAGRPGDRTSQPSIARPRGESMSSGYAGAPSRGPARQATPYESRQPGAMAAPRSSDRPSTGAPGSAQPRGYTRPYPGSPGQAQSRGYDRSTNTPRYAQPRGYDRPLPPTPGTQSRGDVYTRPAPGYAPRYGAPSSGAPRSMPPAYSTPQSVPRAYAAPRSMPYAAPRSMPPAYSAPRSGPPAYGAPRSMPSAPAGPRMSAPSAAPRSAPSRGGSQGGHRGR